MIVSSSMSTWLYTSSPVVMNWCQDEWWKGPTENFWRNPQRWAREKTPQSTRAETRDGSKTGHGLRTTCPSATIRTAEYTEPEHSTELTWLPPKGKETPQLIKKRSISHFRIIQHLIRSRLWGLFSIISDLSSSMFHIYRSIVIAARLQARNSPELGKFTLYCSLCCEVWQLWWLCSSRKWNPGDE